MTDHRPGITWLAARVGSTTGELLADPRRLVDALADAGRAMTGLAVDLTSDDAAVRGDAEREAEQLRRMVVDAPHPRERFRAKVLGALRDATERVRATRGDGRDVDDEDHYGDGGPRETVHGSDD
jgi:hypothetical protein